MTITTWKEGYRPTTLTDPEGQQHPGWLKIEQREPLMRCRYPGADPEPLLLQAPLAHVAVLNGHAASALSTILAHPNEGWRLRVLEGDATLHITEIDLDADGVIEFTGPVYPPGRVT